MRRRAKVGCELHLAQVTRCELPVNTRGPPLGFDVEVVVGKRPSYVRRRGLACASLKMLDPKPVPCGDVLCNASTLTALQCGSGAAARACFGIKQSAHGDGSFHRRSTLSCSCTSRTGTIRCPAFKKVVPVRLVPVEGGASKRHSEHSERHSS